MTSAKCENYAIYIQNYLTNYTNRRLGLNWVCFFGLSAAIYFHNPLYYIDLQSAYGGQDWVCFA